MSDLYAGLREKAEAAIKGQEWFRAQSEEHRRAPGVPPFWYDWRAFTELATPATVLALLDDNARLRAALDEIVDLASLTVVGGDEFDRGVRAARLCAHDIASEALSLQTEGKGT